MESFNQAIQLIEQGGVVAYPTEAIWGLGCDPWSARAVTRLLALKQRPVEKGLILIAADMKQFDFLLKDLSQAQLTLLEQSWPGPYTWLVPHHKRVPDWISGVHSTVAIRVTNHPLARQLCEQTGPLVSTSANLADQPAAKTRAMVEEYFPQQLDAILDGALGDEQSPSRICDLETGQVIRS